MKKPFHIVWQVDHDGNGPLLTGKTYEADTMRGAIAYFECDYPENIPLYVYDLSQNILPVYQSEPIKRTATAPVNQ